MRSHNKILLSPETKDATAADFGSQQPQPQPQPHQHQQQQQHSMQQQQQHSMQHAACSMQQNDGTPTKTLPGSV